MESTASTRADEDGHASLQITGRVILVGFLGGAAGLAAMAPVLIGLPAFLGQFQADPLLDLAALGRAGGVQPDILTGVLVFTVGGTIGIPLLFVVAGAFLPPRAPRYARGTTFAVIMWTGFVLAFWPGFQASVLFLTLSLIGHVIYGLVLGLVMERLAYIPEHDV